ncbi:MAG: PEP-CTERM-box response regulator transcription factor [Syntrophaceae bacterium]|nr:PEP-CTERM-box response regulator transcription factor [Syntrophaceae bacterium]
MAKKKKQETEKTYIDLPKILIVDDDEQIRKQVQWALSEDFCVFSAGNRPSAMDIFKKEDVPVVLLDLGLPPYPREATEGLQALEELIGLNPLVKVIIVSGNSERQNALAAVEKGAHDIFPKPVDMDELKVVLKRVYRRIELEKESIEERNLARRVSFEEIIGTSPPMQEIFTTIQKVAKTDVPVLITGESGTGKELIASAIHNLSKRKAEPFIAINCGAIPDTLIESELFGYEKGSFTGATTQRKGKLEYANNGTLFLDEIGDLAPELQVKILRFLQEKVLERVGGRQLIPVDSRVIAATNQDLEREVKDNRFREDLYFRLAVVKIALPPLRERGSDVIQLAEHLVIAFSKELKKAPKNFSKAALEALRGYTWPGNVRELQNRIKRALVLADGPSIGPTELELDTPDAENGSAATLKEAKEDLERKILANALQENNGNISKTAKALGISRPTLYDLMSRYGL